jgi:CDP-6-deoxy-D-xylo-4-hexulose-3-dehydrase
MEFKWPLMKNNILKADLEVLIKYLMQDNPKLTHGPKVREFERAWSSWLGVADSVMLNSGSSANDLTMKALRILKGKCRVVVPPITWVSDIASVLAAGHSPIFVDVNLETLGIDTKSALQIIDQDIGAVFMTHVLGFNGLDDDFISALEVANIPLIEDVCESHGATHNGKKLGSIGWASNFSFHYAHHLTTIEGGMVSSDDEELIDLIRMLRSHGLVRESRLVATQKKYAQRFPDLNPEFIFAFPSHNMRPTELNAVIGLEQLARLDSNNYARAQNLKLFLENLDDDIYQTEFRINGNSNYAFTAVLRKPDFVVRDKIESSLKSNLIEFRRGLSGGGNQTRQPYLRSVPGIPSPESLTNAEHLHHFAWYIGNFPDATREEITWLTQILNSF